MSSSDRHNRSSRQRPAPAPSEPVYDDDFTYEDEWEVENDFEDPYQPQQPAPRQSAPQPRRRDPDTAPRYGTAAGIDRLRQNIRQQAARPEVARQGRSTARRQSQQTGRYTPPQDDLIVEDGAYNDERDYRRQSRQLPTQSRRAATTSRQPPSAPNDRVTADRVTYDSRSYDDVNDVDDYEDDFGEYDAPRRPARQPRPAAQIRMPNLSRPTLPPAIANADLVNDAPALGFIGVGLVSLAGMAILVANRLDSLAPQFATHVTASGVLENYRGESALWSLPLMAAMFTLMGIVMAWFISPIDRFASRFVLAGALVTQFVIWTALLRII